VKTAVADRSYKVYCLRIVPLWGDPIYITDHVRDLVMGANTYKTDSGYQFSGSSSESNMSPGSVDLDGICGIAGIDRDKITSGVFDNARVYAFATTWNSPVEDEEEIGIAFFGRATIIDGARWSCEGAACTASGGTEQPATRACRRVVQKFGPVTAFTYKGTELSAEELAVCNA